MLNSSVNDRQTQPGARAVLAPWPAGQAPADEATRPLDSAPSATPAGSHTHETLHNLHLVAMKAGKAHQVVQVGDAEELLWEASRERVVQRFFPAGGELRAMLGADGRPRAWWQRHVGLPLRGSKAYRLPYAIPNLSVHAIDTDRRRGRAAQHALQAFFAETFIDDLAIVADADPFEYRRALLPAGSRQRHVLEESARRAGWGSPLAAGRGRGIALVESEGALAAEVVEASLDERGRLLVHRITAVLDSGDTEPQASSSLQAEVALLMGLDAALAEPVPAALRPVIDLHFVRSSAPACEQHETALPAVAPALANALFAASGQRHHALPIAHPTAQVHTGRAPAAFLSL